MNAGPVSHEEWDEHRENARQSLGDNLSGVSILLPYQQELLRATSEHALVVADKSRRVGMTWASGSDAVLTSSSQRSEGGMDTLYLGYNLDMAREFIDTCAMWAKSFSQACSEVEETMFEEEGEKGEHKSIRAFRITFASGFEIQALSSKPRSLRGRQGFVILDEFAFHDDATELLKAAMALLIWGGKVLVLSTHDGEDNPFNELIQEIRAVKRPGKIVRVTFDEALEQGLYKRICLRGGKEWSQALEDQWSAEIYSMYGDAADEELRCIPSRGTGAWLTSSLIDAAMIDTSPVIPLTCPQDFNGRSDQERWSFVQDWLEDEVDPILKSLDKNRRHGYGFDFARSGDLSVYVPIQETQSMKYIVPFVLELRNVPFRQQEQIMFYVTDRLPRFSAGKNDARGNGQALAEFAEQRYGSTRVEAVMLTQNWYLENMPGLKSDFEERNISIPKNSDLKSDLRMVKVVRGIAMVAEGKTKGADGGQRHGDFAVALALARAAIKADYMEYDYRSASTDQRRGHGGDEPDWFRQPVGAGIRGRI